MGNNVDTGAFVFTIPQRPQSTFYAQINCVKAGGGGGGGRAWGGDLIVIVGPGVGLLTDLAFPGEGIFESVFAQCGDIEHRLE